MPETNVNVKVKTGELLIDAGKIISHRDQLDSILEECLTTMKNLNNANGWQSTAATTILENMLKLRAKRFDPYKQVVTEYSEFLKTTALNYEGAERGRTTAANQFA